MAASDHRLTDRLGVVAVVLAALAVRGDETGSHDPDPVTMRLGGCWARNGNNFPRLKVLRNTILPRLSAPCRLKVFFAKSIPIVVTFMTTPPVPLIEMNRLQSGTSDAAGAGGVHIIRWVSTQHPGNLLTDDKHTIRNAVIATVIGGLILSFILWLVGFLPTVWEWIKSGTVWLWGAITSELPVPVWLLGLLLVFGFPLLWRMGVKILSIVVPTKERTTQTATGNPNTPVGIREQHSENELLALKALASANGGPLYLDAVARAIGQNQLRAEQALDLLVNKGLAQYSLNYIYGTSYYLSDKGRDLAIELEYA